MPSREISGQLLLTVSVTQRLAPLAVDANDISREHVSQHMLVLYIDL